MQACRHSPDPPFYTDLQVAMLLICSFTQLIFDKQHSNYSAALETVTALRFSA